MKNWRTTFIGALLAGLSFLAAFQANGGNLSDWKLWIIPALIAVLGYLAKDAGVTGSMKAVGVLLCCTMLLTSCGSTPGGQKTFIGATGAQWLNIGKGVFIRETPIVYGEVKQARDVTSAKAPVGVVNP